MWTKLINWFLQGHKKELVELRIVSEDYSLTWTCQRSWTPSLDKHTHTQWIIDLSVRAKTIKVIRRHQGINIQELSNVFLEYQRHMRPFLIGKPYINCTIPKLQCFVLQTVTSTKGKDSW